MTAAPDFVTKLIKPLEINYHYQLQIIIESYRSMMVMSWSQALLIQFFSSVGCYNLDSVSQSVRIQIFYPRRFCSILSSITRRQLWWSWFLVRPRSFSISHSISISRRSTTGTRSCDTVWILIRNRNAGTIADVNGRSRIFD